MYHNIERSGFRRGEYVHHYYGEHMTFRLFADAQGNQLRICTADEDEWDDLREEGRD